MGRADNNGFREPRAGLSFPLRWRAVPSFEYRHELSVHAPREEAFAWWTDFTAEDHAGERTLHGTRSDLYRDGNSWTWTDEFVTMGFRTHWSWRVEVHPPQWEKLHGETKLGVLDGIITFQDEPKGTRVREVGTFTPRSLGILLMPLARKAFVRLLQADFKEHWADFRKEWDGE